MAKNSDGATVQAIVGRTWPVAHLDFSEIEPYWLLAECDGEPVGVVQVLAGKPVGRVEFLCVRDDVHEVTRGRAMKALFNTTTTVLAKYGSSVASAMVAFESKSVKRWMKRRGAIVMFNGNVMEWR